MTEKKTTWMTSLGHSGDIHDPVITTCNARTHNSVIPARDAEIQPYFHFYAKSKIRGLLYLFKQIDKPYFHFYIESKIRDFLFSFIYCVLSHSPE
ncbi:hypothetical protein [Wolbachia endosymbiont of Ctenocephalides felis wCfeJ]|uniref:hypothetical protein n=1 Tax=Wolbachia endosymbiont of Ctenocephalides felis wCfeJ TaxID=2732594 RepID=UPI001444FBBC|nr:hypothetical protein [Wolbachia endosymbiont of Ctenocephalides felis wCfeJ]